MSGFLEKYNTDEVFLRGLITSLLKSLNDKLKYIQINICTSIQVVALFSQNVASLDTMELWIISILPCSVYGNLFFSGMHDDYEIE